MTEYEKDILITKMLEAPASLSDAEIALILEDEELLELYTVAADVRTALAPDAEIDADAEWRRFEVRLPMQQRRSAFRWAGVAAAVIAGLLAIVGIVSMVTADRSHSESPGIAEVIENGDTGDSTPQAADTTSAPAIPPVVEQLATAHLRNTNCAAAERRQPVDDVDTLDVDEYLRIQQARVDNDLALLRAETIVCSYDVLAYDDEDWQPIDVVDPAGDDRPAIFPLSMIIIE